MVLRFGGKRVALRVGGGIGILAEERGEEACKSRKSRKIVVLRKKRKEYRKEGLVSMYFANHWIFAGTWRKLSI
jgi:hypothetical protein